MKKNIYLTVLMIVTVCCMVFGALYHVAGFFDWGKSEGGVDIAIVEEKLNGETIEAIDADMDLSGLTLQAGEELQVSYEGKEKYKPSVAVENGTLVIKQGVDVSFNIGINNRTLASQLTVVLPKDVVLSNVAVKLDLGTLELDGVSIRTASLKSDVGDINVKNCVLGDMTIDIDAGDVDVQQCKFEGLYIDQDLGEVDISVAQDLMKGADIDMRVSLGTLRVKGQERETDFIQIGEGDVTLRVTNEMGDINLDY